MAGDVAQGSHGSRGFFTLLLGALLASLVLFAAAATTASALPANFFGFQFSPGHTQNEADLEAVARSGAKYWRLPFNCHDKNWSLYNEELKLAASKGISVIANFGGRCKAWAPEFANRLPNRDEWEPASSEMETFVYELIQHYGYWGENGTPISVWEFWNEPNRGVWSNNGFKANGYYYGEILKRVGAALQTAQNNQAKAHGQSEAPITILMGGLLTLSSGEKNEGGTNYYNLSPHDFLAEASEVPGLGSNFNGVASHPYAFAKTSGEAVKPIAERVEENIEHARNATTEFFSSGKSIWITEIGWPVEPEAPVDGAHERVSPALQAELLGMVFGWVKDVQPLLNIQSLLYYNYRDFIDGSSSWDDYSGLRKIDGTFRPAWYAFQQQAGAKQWPVPPKATTGGATSVLPNQASLTTVITAQGLPTTFRFELGKTTSYGSSTSAESAGFGSGPVLKTTPVAGLAASTTYHFRVVATNENQETTIGADKQFTTPASSETFASVKQTLNGNPGWASVGGNVYAAGQSANGLYVNVNFEKWENGQWVYKNTAEPHPVISNNYYEVENWHMLGKGLWRTRTVLPKQGSVEGSESGYHEFEIKDGYQLVNSYSGKCLDVENAGQSNGVNLQQWDCGNPSSSINQVFTLVPQGSGDYQIVSRNSNRCADVINASQSNGAWLQQWDCLGITQKNQIWHGEGVGGGTTYKAKHSSKCLEIGGPSTANGAKAQQWDCLGAGQTNQIWTFKSVESSLIPTHSYLTVNSTLNGQPGFINVSGNVDAGAYSAGGQTVNVNFQKEVSPGNWQTIENETLHVNLNGENHYAWEAWGVGVGQWRTRVVYPGNAPLAGSESEYHYFQIKSGYRLVNRYSGKCMSLSGNNGTSGTAILQWECSGNPTPGDGQVFTLVPMGGGYYELKINSTSKCVDVTGGSTSDGAWLQEWDCLGAGQANQLWQNVELANQPGYFAFIAKHSGKCADLTGPSNNNGVRIQQWSCHWGSNQQWSFQAIN